MKILNAFIVIVFLFYTGVAKIHAVVDKETIYARKCYSLLRHYEKKYHIPQDTLFAIALQETGSPHHIHGKKIIRPWSVNVEGVGYTFDSRQEAVHFVKKQLKSGKKSIDVGLMQVNILHHPYAFKSIDQAFDVRANVEYAAYFLVSKYNQLGSWSKAVAHYHSATESLGSKYHNSVMNIAKNIDNHKLALDYKLAIQDSWKNNLRFNNPKLKQKKVAYNDDSRSAISKNSSPEILPLNTKRIKKSKSYID